MRRELRRAALAALAGVATLAATGALAQSGWNDKGQYAPAEVWRGSDDDDPKPWTEDAVPLPSGLNTSGLIPVEMPGSALRFGVDPQALVVGKDGVIRYVVVATSASGAVNAMQEGIRCATREVKTFARYAPGSGWVASTSSAWQRVTVSSAAVRHSAMILRSGLCGDPTKPAERRTPQDVARDLRSGQQFKLGGD